MTEMVLSLHAANYTEARPPAQVSQRRAMAVNQLRHLSVNSPDVTVARTLKVEPFGEERT